MSDDLDIRGGGAVAVDTVTLRTAADAFQVAAGELEDIAARIGSSSMHLAGTTRAMWDVAHTMSCASRRIQEVVEAAGELSRALRAAAAVYEIVELRTERAAADAAGDAGAVRRIDSRLAALAIEHPDADAQATLAALGHWVSWPGELARQALGALWWLSPGFHLLAVPTAWALQRAVGALGSGTVPTTARLRGQPGDLVLSPVAPPAPATAPTSLAGAAERIPTGGQARVRVERYSMPDGSRRFAVYVTGTQTIAPRTTEPFDMDANIELYTGARAASYEATELALRESGARPGDIVHAFGHSQGAMVAAHLALEGDYDTQTLVSFGSPVEADLGEGTLSVSVRHADDPVAALAGGGHAGTVGAPGSFVAERTADPRAGLHDFGLPAHALDSYTATARMLDTSADPRMAAVRQVFADLASAASVQVTEYAAERILPLPDPSPGPVPGEVNPSSSGAG
ncbi:hypothetical protein NQ152_04600 [Microbacterium sp. zg.B48]|uniref:hypothetical protein n=1 Tax=Microbacterium sp. zg.B48 TaxID=2969408 RepID=UPI00214B6E87|nr:hypothetical protein [Microbacterium sp. zg.B48]MCR2762783.1 hypothetical protein [Microbacterium sp. zg.B48]